MTKQLEEASGGDGGDALPHTCVIFE
jgi:hypothetical protein